MANYRTIFILLFLIFCIVAGCSQDISSSSPENTRHPYIYLCDNLPEDRIEYKVFKGIELYSYKNNNDEWVFSVLAGTNRAKTYEEVLGEALNFNQLGECFCRFAVGDTVYWRQSLLMGPWEDEYIHMFSIPPQGLISEVKRMAVACEIGLWVDF